MTVSNERTLQAIKYVRGKLEILDQLQLPHISIYIDVPNSEVGHSVIKTMQVRGAPAIAIVAALSLAVEVYTLKDTFNNSSEVLKFVTCKLDYLKTSRPTAVNLTDAATKLVNSLKAFNSTSTSSLNTVNHYLDLSEKMLEDDVKDNKAIGNFGKKFLLDHYHTIGKTELSLLTHCNTGSLATAGYGTALGIIRSIFYNQQLIHAYCTETRPYNQGSRLTAYELSVENIPSTLICDSMVTYLMSQGKVDGIVVGADRVAKNGDTANKIGTYQLAVLASYFRIPFVVAAPTTSIDFNCLYGKDIVIETRPAEEVKTNTGVDAQGNRSVVKVADPQITVWNPAFDVTPANLISAIITEKGIITPNSDSTFDLKAQVQKLNEAKSP